MIFPPKNENLIKIATKTDAKWHCEWTREKENAFLWLNARVKYFDSDESGIRGTQPITYCCCTFPCEFSQKLMPCIYCFFRWPNIRKNSYQTDTNYFKA